MQYFVTPSHCIAVNCKVASESICEAIVRNFGSHYQRHNFWREMVDQTDTPDKPCVMLIRHPVERFLSTFAMMRDAGDDSITVDGLLDLLKQNTDDPRLQPQSDFVKDVPDIKVFAYPWQIDGFCDYVGIDYLNLNNASKSKKPKLTSLQIEAIKSYYSADLELYIHYAGQDA